MYKYGIAERVLQNLTIIASWKSLNLNVVYVRVSFGILDFINYKMSNYKVKLLIGIILLSPANVYRYDRGCMLL